MNMKKDQNYNRPTIKITLKFILFVFIFTIPQLVHYNSFSLSFFCSFFSRSRNYLLIYGLANQDDRNYWA